jgi:hypothetical protein
MRKIVRCKTHGSGFAAYLCIHLAGSIKGGGFFEAEPEPGRGPVAWCRFCEHLRVDIEQTEWHEAIVDLLCVVCQTCFNLEKARRTKRRKAVRCDS